MPVRLRPRYFGELSREEILKRLDPLDCILNGAFPTGVFFTEHFVENYTTLVVKPPFGEMLGWLEKETNKLTIGMLVHKEGYTYIEDEDDKWLAEYSQQKIWIRFDNPVLLSSYKEEDQLTVAGEFSGNVVATHKQLPDLKREVLWMDTEGDIHLGKRINNEEMEISTYGGQDDLIKSLNNFPFWLSIPTTYIAHRLKLGDEPLDEED